MSDKLIDDCSKRLPFLDLNWVSLPNQMWIPTDIIACSWLASSNRTQIPQIYGCLWISYKNCTGLIKVVRNRICIKVSVDISIWTCSLRILTIAHTNVTDGKDVLNDIFKINIIVSVFHISQFIFLLWFHNEWCSSVIMFWIHHWKWIRITYFMCRSTPNKLILVIRWNRITGDSPKIIKVKL